MPITDLDRSGYFGASDVSMMLRSWETKTFKNWWLVKLGVAPNPELRSSNIRAGNLLEIPILEALEIDGMQFGKEPFVFAENKRFRVNLDGFTHDTIYEVKSCRADIARKYNRTPPVDYVRQCQGQMLASEKRMCYLVIYAMKPEDYTYDNLMFPNINKTDITLIKIPYDPEFEKEFVPVLNYLTDCLIREVFPSEKEMGHLKRKRRKAR